MLRAHLTRADLSDQTIADAVTMRLAAAIEAIAQGSDGLQKRLFDGEWHVVWATRNRIAHSYKDHGSERSATPRHAKSPAEAGLAVHPPGLEPGTH